MLSHHVRNWLLCLMSLLVASAVSAQTEPWAGNYLYDGAGNIKAIGQNHYVYDPVSRLKQGTAITTAQQSVQQYSYDAFGNLLTTIVDGDAAHPFAVAVKPETNRAEKPDACPAGSTCFLGTYDEAGNQTGFASTSYTYDSSSALTALSSLSGNEIYLYDADDQRVVTVDYAGAGIQTWHYTLRDLGAKIVREVDDSVTASSHAVSWKKDYVGRNGGVLASITPATSGELTLHFHLDHLATPRLITTDGARSVAMHTYFPFGLEAPGSDADIETIRFTGHERDFTGDGNNLDYMHARYYSSAASRLLSIDPAPGTPGSPQSWNRYAYASNRPVANMDPNGRHTLCPVCATPEAKKISEQKSPVIARPGVQVGGNLQISAQYDAIEGGGTIGVQGNAAGVVNGGLSRTFNKDGTGTTTVSYGAGPVSGSISGDGSASVGGANGPSVGLDKDNHAVINLTYNGNGVTIAKDEVTVSILGSTYGFRPETTKVILKNMEKLSRPKESNLPNNGGLARIAFWKKGLMDLISGLTQ